MENPSINGCFGGTPISGNLSTSINLPWYFNIATENGPVEIVAFPIQHGEIFQFSSHGRRPWPGLHPPTRHRRGVVSSPQRAWARALDASPSSLPERRGPGFLGLASGNDCYIMLYTVCELENGT